MTMIKVLPTTKRQRQWHTQVLINVDTPPKRETYCHTPPLLCAWRKRKMRLCDYDCKCSCCCSIGT
jgi:hypothetical protein